MFIFCLSYFNTTVLIFKLFFSSIGLDVSILWRKECCTSLLLFCLYGKQTPFTSWWTCHCRFRWIRQGEHPSRRQWRKKEKIFTKYDILFTIIFRHEHFLSTPAIVPQSDEAKHVSKILSKTIPRSGTIVKVRSF